MHQSGQKYVLPIRKVIHDFFLIWNNIWNYSSIVYSHIQFSSWTQLVKNIFLIVIIIIIFQKLELKEQYSMKKHLHWHHFQK